MPKNKPRKIFAVPHFHFDLEWWKPEDGYARDVDAIVARALDLLRDHPDFTYTLDQALAVTPFWNNNPERRGELRRAVAEGRVELVGGTYCAPDENIPTGEALIRQFEHGLQFFEGDIGGRVTTGWEIDEFGHPAQMPQILAKCGMKQFVFARGVQPRDLATHPVDFVWEGPDGSRILTHWLAMHYTAMVPSSNLRRSIARFGAELRARMEYEGKRAAAGLLFVPFGMDFLEPSPHWPEFMQRWNKRPGNPPAEFSLPARFFGQMRAANPELPIVSGELNPMFTGCYDSRERVKKQCRASQHAAVEAERLASVASSSGWMKWPAATLDSAWKNILKNDFHDVLCGTGTDPVYRNTMSRYDAALAGIGAVRDEALASIARRADTASQPGDPVLIVNSLAAARRELVAVPAPKNAASFDWEAAGPDGAKTPCQLAGGELIFIADLPPVGYAVYHITKKKPAAKKKTSADAAASGPFRIDGLVFENDVVRIALDPRTGALFSLIDKRSGRETLDTSHCFSNELLVEEDIGNLWSVYKTGREWRADRYPVHIRFIETGPVRATAEITGAHMSMNRRQLVSLTAGSPRVDFHTHIDFSGRDLRVRTLFGLKSSGGAVFETPFHATGRGDGHHCAENWVDVTAADGAGATLLNRGIPGCEIDGEVASLALLRSISVLPNALPGYLLKNLPALLEMFTKTARLALGNYGMGMAEWSTHPFHLISLREWASEGGDPKATGGNPIAADHLLPIVNFSKPSLAWEHGTHDFHYALLPHAGGWRDARLTAEGLAFNTPPQVVRPARSKGSLPAAHSFFDLGRDSAATLVTIKKSLDGAAFTARVFDSGGAGADVRIRAWAPIAKCEKTDMMEKKVLSPVKVASGIARDRLSPWEIATYRFTLKKPAEKEKK